MEAAQGQVVTETVICILARQCCYSTTSLYSHKETNRKRIQPEKPSLTQDSVFVLHADNIKTERTTIRENGKETMSRHVERTRKLVVHNFLSRLSAIQGW